MYHVVISVNPYDCMGQRAKDLAFIRLEDALVAYKHYMADKETSTAEFLELFWDEEAIEDARKDGDSLIVVGQIYVLLCDYDFLSMQEVDNFEYGCWINDYDGITYEHYCTNLMELYDSFGAETICTYEFEISLLEYDENCYLKTIASCEQSIRDAKDRIEYLLEYEKYERPDEG